MKIITGLMGILFPLLVNAAETLNIDVSAEASAAACSVTLSNEGKIDYGHIHTAMRKSQYDILDEKKVMLSIACETATGVAIASRDTRADSVISSDEKNRDHLFGLGKTVTGQPVGAYLVRIDDEHIALFSGDGTATSSVDVIQSLSAHSMWIRSSLPFLFNSESTLYSFSRKGSTVPLPVLVAQIPLKIKTTVVTTLGGAENIHLDGEAVISLVYL